MYSHFLSLDMPHLEENPVFRTYEDISLLQWGTVNGIYNRTIIEKCQHSNEQCNSLLDVTRENRSFFAQTNNYLGYEYYFVIYQETDEIVSEMFTTMDYTGKNHILKVLLSYVFIYYSIAVHEIYAH